ncbi:MAG: DUF721 domain-containing protein [Saprospiraceae bacterium]|nr:DUF721 domain-containing protein [Saprospiraceae bacterium]
MKRTNNETSLKEALKAMIEAYRLKPHLHQTQIKGLWAEKMGPTIAAYTTEIKLYRKKLFLTITSASLKQELAFGKDKIRDMLNEALGEDAIEDVVIR